ncbi:MAG: agmatinase [Euryarchaeota archaeon]|nr:agmatinase [Euryarchaeota archaeon]
MIFADSISDYTRSLYVIYGVLFDGTSSFRAGSRWAPEAIRKGSYNFEPYDYDYDCDLANVPVYDMGDAEFGNVNDMIAELQPTIFRVIKDGKVPIILGGEHSVTLPCIRALAQDTSVTAVIFDAHLDLKECYLGNMYGHASVSRNILGCSIPLIQIGVRSGTRAEYQYAREKSTFFTMDQIRRDGIGNVLNSVSRLIESNSVYLSIDMDVLDPAYAPGVGNPEPYGLTPFELRTAIRHLAPLASGFDVVEIAPDYDMGMSAIAGAKIVRDFVVAHSNVHILLT